MNRDLFAASGGVIDATTDPYFNYTTLLLSGDGTNGAQNNTFVDASTNNTTITRAGTPTQGSFSPFSQTGWSGYFDGSSYLEPNASLNTTIGGLAGSLWTMESWVYVSSISSGNGYRTGIFGTYQAVAAQRWWFGYNSTNGTDITAMFTTATSAGAEVQTGGTITFALNSWVHLAVTIDASTASSSTITLYVNGVGQSFTGKNLSSFTTNYTAPPIGGNYSQYVNNHTGYISNLRLVKGVAVYIGNFTVPIAPLTATQAAGTNIAAITGTATSLLTLQDNRFKDNALAPNAITVGGTPSVQAFSPLAPTAAYSLPAAAAGSAYFNGTNNSLITPTSALYDFGSGAFTVECWIYPTVIGTIQELAFHGWAGSGGLNYGWRAEINASNQLQFYVNGDTRVFTDIVVTSNTWNHLAITGSAGTLSAYKNGVKSVTTWSYSSFVDRPIANLVIGGFNDTTENAAARWFYKGYISNFRVVKGTAVYTGAFTPPSAPLTAISGSGYSTSLLTLQDTTFKDKSGNTLAITASSPAPVIQSFTPFTQVWGGYFDGSSYLSMPNSAGFQFPTGTDFTVECWVNFNSVSGGSSQQILSPWGGNSGWQLYWQGASKKFTWYANASAIILGTMVPVANTWYHVAISRQSGVIKSFVNGVLDYSVADTANYAQTSPLYIGVETASIGYLSGYISNVRIVKGTAVYTTTSTIVGAVVFTPPAKTLSATQAAGVNISAIFPGQTSLLTLQDPTFKDNAILPNTITASATPPKAQLVSAPFTSAATVDPVNGSGYFNGTSNLAVPAGAPFNLTTVDFCIEMWVYPIAQSTYGALLSFDVQDFPLMFQWASAGSANIRFYAGSSTAWISGTPLDFGTTVLNTWAHICVTRTNGVFRTFKDGILSTVLAGQEAYSIGNSAGSVYVGSNGAAGGFSTAYISNLRIIKGTGNVPVAYQTSSTTSGTAIFQPPSAPLTAVTGTSLLTLQDTTFIDKSGNTPAITTSATPPVMRAFTPFASNWGGYFNGSTNYLLTTNVLSNAGNFTIECWVYPQTSASGRAICGAAGWELYLSGFAVNFVYHSVAVYSSSLTLKQDCWNHVVVERYNFVVGTSGGYKIFVNGVMYDTGAFVAGGGTALPTQMGLLVGGSYYASTPRLWWAGYISNLRIVNDTAVYTANFTPPSAPLTAITGTSLLTLQNNTFIDNATPPNTITATGSPKTQLLNLPFTSSITKVAAPWNISVTAPLATVGGSMYFDGSSGEGGSANNLTLPAILATTLLGSSDFTIECWFYMTAAPVGRSYCLITNYYNSTNGYSINVNSSRLITFNAAGDGTNITGTTVLPINSWHHLALCNTGGTSSKLYINGIQEGSTFTGTHRVGGVSQPFWIGQLYAAAYYSNFTGYIANFRVAKGVAVYTGAFTPPTAPPQPTQTPGLLGTNVNAVDGTNTSLLLLGSNAGIYDATAKNDIITVGNAQVSSTQIKYGTGAMYFDGTGDYINCGYSPQFDFGTGDFTVECWVYTTSYATAQGLFESRVKADVVEANRLIISILVTSGYPQLYNASNDVAVISTIAIPLNTWTHVACTRNSGTARVFVNGQVGATNASFTTNFLVNKLVIGAWIQVSGGGVYNRNFINGYIDDYRITKGIARYTAAFTPPTKAMIGQ